MLVSALRTNMCVFMLSMYYVACDIYIAMFVCFSLARLFPFPWLIVIGLTAKTVVALF